MLAVFGPVMDFGGVSRVFMVTARICLGGRYREESEHAKVFGDPIGVGPGLGWVWARAGAEHGIGEDCEGVNSAKNPHRRNRRSWPLDQPQQLQAR